MKKKTKSYDLWTKLGLIFFAAIALYMALAIYFEKSRGIALPMSWLLLGAGLFTATMTTGGVKEGRFYAQFYDCSKSRAPVSFWATAILGYAFAASLLAFSIYESLNGN